MFFFLRQLMHRLTTDWRFLWVALLPPLAYAGFMALTPSLYTLSSTYTFPENAPLAHTGDPTGVASLSTLTSSPSGWRAFVKANFNPHRIMGYPRGYGQPPAPQIITSLYEEALNNLSAKGKQNSVQIIYTGSNQDLGSRLVFYYSSTLHQRVLEGYKRQGSHFNSPLTTPPVMDPTVPPARLLWSHERTLPTMIWFVSGVFGLLLIQIIRELMDTSYRSEKQIAEHTLLPILGSLPNLNTIPVAVETSQRRDM